MAVVTLEGHVSRAKDFYDKTEIFFCLGRTSEWPDETKPPIPQNTDTMEEPAGYKLIETKFLVKPVDVADADEAQLSYRGSRWQIVPYEDAVKEGARWVYISTNINYNDFSTSLTYRQIGIYTGLEKMPNVPVGTSALAPDQVKNPGILEAIDNRTPVYRDMDQREVISTILEF